MEMHQYPPTQLHSEKRKKAINDAGPLLGDEGFDADELSLVRANKCLM